MSEKKGQANGGLKGDALEVNQQFLSNRTQADSLEINIKKPKLQLYPEIEDLGKVYQAQLHKLHNIQAGMMALEREREILNQVLFHLLRIQELDSVPPPSETKTDSQLLSSVPAQRCLEKGVSDGMGLKANKIFREKNHEEVCHSKKGQPNGGLNSDALEVNQQCLSNHTQADSLGINIEKPKFPQYAVAAKRKDPYKNWPAHLNIDPAVMIDAGLVFTGENDSVRCYHRGGGLRNWEITDDPWEEHAKWYPSCPHVRLVKGQDYIERVGRGERPEPDCVPPPQPEKKTDSQLQSTERVPKSLENGVSDAMGLKANKIFREKNHGVNDSVHCYHCGVGLCNRKTTDDPWEDHVKLYPSCPRVRLVKEQDYIERVGRGENPGSDCVPPPSEKKTYSQLLSTVPSQSCLENRFSEAMVLKAIKIFMEKNHGSTEFKAADIAEIILDLDDDGVTDGASSSVDASPVFNCCEKRDCGQNCEPRESSQEKDAGEVEQLYLENQRLKENQMCKIRRDDVANVIFLPCGHIASCPQCYMVCAIL